MKTLYVIAIGLIVGSCKPSGQESGKANMDQDSSACRTKKKPLMYKPSPMAMLMEQMYAEHQAVRAKVNKAKPLGKFPGYYNQIKRASLTDPSDRDAFFEQKSTEYLGAEMTLYNNPTIAHYNEAIQACLVCHAEKCGGPVPRIKKLLIK